MNAHAYELHRVARGYLILASVAHANGLPERAQRYVDAAVRVLEVAEMASPTPPASAGTAPAPGTAGS